MSTHNTAQYERDVRFNNHLRMGAGAAVTLLMVGLVEINIMDRAGAYLLCKIALIYLVATIACHHVTLNLKNRPDLADIFGSFNDVVAVGFYLAFFGSPAPPAHLHSLHLMGVFLVLFGWANVRPAATLPHTVNAAVVGIFAAAFIDVGSANPLFSFGGRVGLVCTFVAISFVTAKNKSHRDEEMRLARERLAQQATQIERFRLVGRHHDKLRSLGVLTAGMVHEANNIIAAVVGNLHRSKNSILVLSGLAEELDDPDGDPQLTRNELREEVSRLKEIEARCSSAMNRLTELSNNARTFSRRESKLRTPSDPNDAIQVALRLVEPQLRSGVRITTDLSDLPMVAIDPNGLCQVMVNLFINALYAAGPRGEVAVSSGVREGQCIIEVADNGSGIPREIRSRIFNPFFSSKPKEEGTGLGLSLSREIILEQGGTLEVRDRPTGGSIFTIRLPLDGGEPEDGLDREAEDDETPAAINGTETKTERTEA